MGVGRGAEGAAERVYLNFKVVVDSDKDSPAHVANDARRVAPELVHVELDVLPADEQGLTTKHCRAHLHRDPCARAGEQQRNRLEELRPGR